MSKSLVADYASSSSEEDNPSSLESGKEIHAVPLASALEMLDQTKSKVSNSVFGNPYREAENYEQSLLERHVKMTAVKEPELKKKICFKFFKGKCQLGEKCHFLHSNPVQYQENDASVSDSEDNIVVAVKQKSASKRCGLNDSLTPPKKYMKTYKKSQQF